VQGSIAFKGRIGALLGSARWPGTHRFDPDAVSMPQRDVFELQIARREMATDGPMGVQHC
jgi:hypothetical protein